MTRTTRPAAGPAFEASVVGDGHLGDMDAEDGQPDDHTRPEAVLSDAGATGLRERVAAWAEQHAWLENVQYELADPTAPNRELELEAVAIVEELADVFDRVDESTSRREDGKAVAPQPVTVLDLREPASELRYI